MTISRKLSLSRSQERRVAKDVSGRPTPASGATSSGRGDVAAEHFLIECKYTEAGSFSLKCAELLKIGNQARARGKIPAFIIDFIGRGQYALVEYSLFKDFIEDYVR